MDLDTLNPPQKEAVTTTSGPVLILAGAGSGKTRVLTARIAYLIEEGLAQPTEILAVTFTNKAAGEMKERVAALLGKDKMMVPWMGTFHSICVKILRIDGQSIGVSKSFSIYDTDDQLNVVKQALEKLNISTKEVNPRAVLSYISSAKNEMVDPEDYKKYAQGFFQETVAKIYPIYQQVMKENNALDFDDLLMTVVSLFKKHPDILKKYQERFKYILVDEYQDTNHVQYLLVSMLAEAHRNICVVGDDDQSIYAFRGATIRNILNFERDYKDAKVIKLEQNYRSTQVILDAAYEVVRKNKQRTEKKLWTDKKGGELITLYLARDEKDEGDYVAKRVKELELSGVSLDDVAVLYRTNAQSRALEEQFIRAGLNYKIVGGVRFYERKEIKDILSYLRCLYNGQDSNSLQRIVNVPRRGVGAKGMDELQMMARSKGKSLLNVLLEDNEEIGNKQLKSFALTMQELYLASNEKPIVDLINYILEKVGYIEMLEDGTSENEARIENLKELISVAAKYDGLEPQAGLSAFLEDVALVEGGGEQDRDVPSVTLMTIHAAKGLEFTYVFVVGMEEGLFPHSRVFTDPNELEEERRLAYVALTRAKKKLYITHTDSRLYFGARQQNMLSRFVEEIPENLVERSFEDIGSGWKEYKDEKESWGEVPEPVALSVGERVKHEYFGLGTVRKLDETMVVVDFGPVYGKKELAREFAPLSKV